MTDQHIVAMGGGGFSDDDPRLDRYVVDLAGTSSPRVCFVPTASGKVVPRSPLTAQASTPASTLRTSRE